MYADNMPNSIHFEICLMYDNDILKCMLIICPIVYILKFQKCITLGMQGSYLTLANPNPNPNPTSRMWPPFGLYSKPPQQPSFGRRSTVQRRSV